MNKEVNTNKKVSANFKTRITTYVLIGLASGFLNGLFGAGGGCVVVPAMEKFLNTEERKAHACAVAVILLMSVVSAYRYVKNGQFDFKMWSLVAAGGVLGGACGAAILPKISVKWLKIGFGTIIIYAALRMMFN